MIEYCIENLTVDILSCSLWYRGHIYREETLFQSIWNISSARAWMTHSCNELNTLNLFELPSFFSWQVIETLIFNQLFQKFWSFLSWITTDITHRYVINKNSHFLAIQWYILIVSLFLNIFVYELLKDYRRRWISEVNSF